MMLDQKPANQPPLDNPLRRPIYLVTIQRQRPIRRDPHEDRQDRRNHINVFQGSRWMVTIVMSCTGVFVALVLLGFLAYLGLFGTAAYFILSNF
jgi:hypothetical protein